MKKKFLSKMMMVALVLCSMFLISACSWQKDVNIKTIEIVEESVPIIIRVGEFDQAGIEMLITYEDNSTETISITSELISDEYLSCLETPGIYEIEILFKGEKVILNITIVEASTYMVEFYNGKEQLIDRQFVKSGEDAVAPNDTNYTMYGYEFIGWDRLFTNVTKDIKVYGVYSKVVTEEMNAYVQEKMVNAFNYMYSNDYIMTVVGTDAYLNYHFDVEKQQGQSQVIMYDGENLEELQIANKDEIVLYNYDYDAETWNKVVDDLTDDGICEEERCLAVMFGGDVARILFLEETEYVYSYQLSENRNIYTVQATYEMHDESDETEKIVFTFDDEKVLSVKFIANYVYDSERVEESMEFLIEYKTENFFLFGDANQDGEVQSKDITRILNHIRDAGNYPFTSTQLLASDVNLDGKVDDYDVSILAKYLTNYSITLPFMNVCGDVNLDGEINTEDASRILQHIDNIVVLTGEQLVCADVNVDGNVDAFDAELIQLFAVKKIESLPFAYKCGDASLDGVVNIGDVTVISRHIENLSPLSEAALIAADVNLDGKIDYVDVNALRKYLVGNWGIEHLPCSYELGDVNLDGEINSYDIDMLSSHLNVEDDMVITGLSLASADVNMDHEIDETDLTLLQQFVGGEITNFPYEIPEE